MNKKTQSILAPSLIAFLLSVTCFAASMDDMTNVEQAEKDKTEVRLETRSESTRETELPPLKLSPLKDRLLSPIKDRRANRGRQNDASRVRPNPGFVPTGHPSLPGTMW